MNTLYILGLIITFLIVIFTLFKKNKKLYDYLLSFFILLLGSNLLVIYSMTTSEYRIFSSIILIDIFYWILLGPIIFIFTKVIINKEFKLSWKYLFTLIPGILILLIFSPYLFGNLQNFFMDLNKESLIHQFGIFLWMNNLPVFTILSLIILRNYLKQNDNEKIPVVQKTNLILFFILTVTFTIYLIFQLSRPVFFNLFGLTIPFNSYAVTWFVEMAYILGLGYIGLKSNFSAIYTITSLSN